MILHFVVIKEHFTIELNEVTQVYESGVQFLIKSYQLYNKPNDHYGKLIFATSPSWIEKLQFRVRSSWEMLL